MLSKVSYPKLIEQCALSFKNKSSIQIIACDDPFLKLWIQKSYIHQSPYDRLVWFSSKEGVQAALECYLQESLFGDSNSVVFELPDRWSKSFEEQFKNTFNLIPKTLPAHFIFLAPSYLKKNLDDFFSAKKFIHSTSLTKLVCYLPTEFEIYDSCSVLQKIVLANDFDFQKQSKISDYLVLNYGDNMAEIYSHLVRMKSLNLLCQEAGIEGLSTNPSLVLSTLSQGNKSLLSKRLEQVEAAGEKPESIFYLCLSFMRQLAMVLISLEQHKPMALVFTELKIPYPIQSRFSQAIKVHKLNNVLQFLKDAANLEMNLRLIKSDSRLGWKLIEKSLLGLF
jgi:DNA polymerase III delta subunit